MRSSLQRSTLDKCNPLTSLAVSAFEVKKGLRFPKLLESWLTRKASSPLNRDCSSGDESGREGGSRSAEEFFSLSGQRRRFHGAKLHDERGAENDSGWGRTGEIQRGWGGGTGDKARVHSHAAPSPALLPLAQSLLREQLLLIQHPLSTSLWKPLYFNYLVAFP